MIDVELTVSPVRGPGGQVIGASTVGRDITERQRAVDELRRSRTRLELAEAVVRMGSAEWDLATGHVVWSPGMYSILQLEPAADGLEHEPDLRDRVHPRDRELLRHALDQVLSGLGGVSLQYRAIRADGRVRVLDWHADTVFDRHGKPARVIEVVHDITDSRRMQPTLGGASSKLAAYSPLIVELASAVSAELEQQLLQAALTEKQLEVLRLIAQGLTNAEIGKRLFIAEGTVKWHVKQILEKTESTNRTEAVARVLGAAAAGAVGVLTSEHAVVRTYHS